LKIENGLKVKLATGLGVYFLYVSTAAAAMLFYFLYVSKAAAAAAAYKCLVLNR